MTSALITILRNDQHPTYGSLMTNISLFLWDANNDMQKYFKTRKKLRDTRIKASSSVLTRAQAHDGLSQDLRDAINSLSTDADNDKDSLLSDQVQEQVLSEQQVQEPSLGSQMKLDLYKDRFVL